MLTLYGLARVPEGIRSVVCIGTFDGVHLGHAEVIGTTVRLARERGLSAVVMTFDRHPMETLAPDRAPLVIASLSSDLKQIRGIGADISLVLAFDSALSELPAQTFFEDIMRGALGAEAVVMGHDFAFGHGREGTGEWLKSRIETVVVGPLLMEGERISSTAIRTAVSEGRVTDAATKLGRLFSLSGIIVRGNRIGSSIGFPTANLVVEPKQVIPGDGVYSGEASLGDASYLAAIGIGMRPTVGGSHRTIEAHLLDYRGGDLYGRHMELSFGMRLRDEAHFESLEALSAQMERDVALVRENAPGFPSVIRSR
ncbi:MAG: Riboflavin biosynthesis protein RibF [Fimbriimonadaceae bacterium]|nr:Riboflavin biosynthesis protein RibF [Fimbriimonadaceae bacterium]